MYYWLAAGMVKLPFVHAANAMALASAILEA